MKANRSAGRLSIDYNTTCVTKGDHTIRYTTPTSSTTDLLHLRPTSTRDHDRPHRPPHEDHDRPHLRDHDRPHLRPTSLLTSPYTYRPRFLRIFFTSWLGSAGRPIPDAATAATSAARRSAFAGAARERRPSPLSILRYSTGCPSLPNLGGLSHRPGCSCISPPITSVDSLMLLSMQKL